MKEATGEVSMTVVTLVAIAVIGAILAANWDRISDFVQNMWSGDNQQAQCEAIGKTWNSATGTCD